MTPRPIPSRVVVAALVASALVAAPVRGEPPARAGLAPVRLAVTKAELSNGLEVILHEDHRTPVVSVNLWYHVGSKDEPAGKNGFAHLFEHLMFQGSKHVADGAYVRDLERAGGTFINASTSLDRTNYFETVPKSRLELALWLESDRMGFLEARLDQATFAAEREVVLNERVQTHQVAPCGMVESFLVAELYPSEHPYHRLAMGSPDDLRAATLDETRAFFRTWYVPNNATLVIAGDVDAAAALALAEEYFGAIPPGKLPDRAKWNHPAAVTLVGEKVLDVAAGVELPRVYMAWPTPHVFASGDAELDIAASALAGGKRGRLGKRLVDELQIAESVTAYQESQQLGSKFVVVATARPGRSVDSLRAAIDEELRRLSGGGADGVTGITEDELARGKASALSGIVFSVERDSGRANLINSYNQLSHDPAYLPRDMARYESATAASVTEAVRRYLPLDRRVVVVVTPDRGAPASGVLRRVDELPVSPGPVAAPFVAEAPPPIRVTPDAPFRRAAPRAGPVVAFVAPEIHELHLRGGLRVLLAERHDLPIVSVRVVTTAGAGDLASSRAPPGAVSMMGGMLEQGTASRSALQVSDAYEALGGRHGTWVDWDWAGAAVKVTSDQLDAALAVLADVVMHPSFPAEELDRLRARRLAALEQEQSSPSAMAAYATAASLYGGGRARAGPYGHAITGQPSDVQRVDRDDLLRAYAALFTPKTCAVIVAGDVTPTALVAKLEGAFGAWSATTPPPPPSNVAAREATRGPSAQPNDGPRLVIVDRPGAPEAWVRLAEVGVAEGGVDRDAVAVMNAIFGGMPSSRIYRDLGDARGASSRFDQRHGRGPFVASATVKTEATAAAIGDLLKAEHAIQDALASPEELLAAKESLKLALPGRFETVDGATQALADLAVYHLPLDEYATLPARIDRVTAEDVRKAARAHLSPRATHVIVVGDRAALETSLAPLHLGPVEPRDAYGDLLLHASHP